MANAKLNDPWQRLLLLMVLMLAVNFAYLLLFAPQQEPVADLSYSRFKAELARDRVANVRMSGEQVTGSFREAVELPGKENTASVAYLRFKTVLPPVADPELLPLLEKNGVEIEAQASGKPTFWSSLLISLLPWVLIIGVWVFILKRMRESNGPGGGLFGQFRRSGAKLYSQQLSRVTFNDVAGLAEAKQELAEIIAYLRDPRHFTRLGGKVPRGILLVGPPGTGKTLLARAVAGEAEVPFFTISASQFIEMFVGVGASRVRDLFENAKKNAPSIIFIDELDAVGRSRGTGLGGGNDEREQTLNQLLSELDGFEAHQEVIVLAATNRPDVLDTALLRPGRFDRQVVVERPDWRDRLEILKVHARKVKLAEEVDLTPLAKGTPGMVGADLEAVMNEAALIAGREEEAEAITNDHLEKAKERHLLGMERKLYLSDEEKRITAIHEAGHTLVAKCLPGSDPIHKVTIIPRGQALGVTLQLPADDRYHYRYSYLTARLAISLGGRAAEKLIFGEYSTGAQNDLKQATDLAEKMVCQWGMSERLGPVSLERGVEHPFLGRKLATEKTFSEETARLIDKEIEALSRQAERRAENLLEWNRPVLEGLAERLLTEESLDEAALTELFAKTELRLAQVQSMDKEGRS
ncbi:ATP-dependent zinc metalloprotease FtsH [Trichloromonas sp.]|uniref:ATP-dependent zinc metalloprotease FtsH n=1 Tax=Trichloromonas sp. TaxID=3069249 RepID=UPI002A3F1820|nr:ATP-dependent zinc metalloprotease FtsH [Trichloromonas sp.]